ncbi:hypothetical protein A8C32_17215 [Flavivirga aquatica]|uniref:Uncharacterized protein n=1 Tax=Flavivirga aquatica TaxID=1849968 RepID=A0A1E5T868_9FLAO|nr:hypothetical protein [Flavivirga aquatica]OEK07536.1 hypothetical protein A8C32_17215 [Flavivirga aquatica]
MKTFIKQSPRQIFKSICVFSAQGLWFKAREVAEELTNRGASGLWLDLAFDLADGLRKIRQISSELFVLNNQALTLEEKNIIEEASYWVSDKLKQEPATLIIDVSLQGSPIHAITGINGFGFISASRSDLVNKSLMVHEITHCTLMSRSLFLDEGLATLFQDQVSDEKLLIEPKYWDRPSLAALIEMDWSNDPYFSNILPTNKHASDPLKNDLRVHFLAATIVDLMIRKNSVTDLVKVFQQLKPQLREGRSPTVIKELFSIDLWQLDAEIINNTTLSFHPPSNNSIIGVASKILAEEDMEEAKLWLPTARIKAYESVEALIALIKILIVLGNNRKEPIKGLPYRTEALVAMNWFESKSNNDHNETLDLIQAYKYVFKLRNAGHAIELRTIGTQASNAFKELLLKYPEQPQIIVACARAQIRIDYYLISQSEWTEKLKMVKSIPSYEKAVNMLIEEHSRFIL